MKTSDQSEQKDAVVGRALEWVGQRKAGFDKYFDPLWFWIGANAGYIYGTDRALDAVSQRTETNEGLAMFLTYLGAGVALPLANKYAFAPLAKSISKFHERRRAEGKSYSKLTLARTAGQIASFFALFSALNFTDVIDNYKWDGKRVIGAFARDEKQVSIDEQAEEEAVDATPQTLEERVPKDIDLSGIAETNRLSTRGRFLRTYRWKDTLAREESQHGVEQGLLSALAMREGYGNPLELNSGNDGGAGMFQFQPGTGRSFGLKVYGKSRRSGRDRNHGLKLRELVRQKRWNYEKLSKIDERFDVAESSDAAARFLVQLKRKHGSWDSALSAYNRGTPASNPRSTNHVRMTRHYQRYYLEQLKSMDIEVDPSVLGKLEKQNGFAFEYARRNSKGKSVFKYKVNEGDSPSLIALNFNRWNKKHGSAYREAGFRNIVDSSGDYIGSDISPKQTVYVLADKK